MPYPGYGYGGYGYPMYPGPKGYPGPAGYPLMYPPPPPMVNRPRLPHHRGRAIDDRQKMFSLPLHSTTPNQTAGGND